MAGDIKKLKSCVMTMGSQKADSGPGSENCRVTLLCVCGKVYMCDGHGLGASRVCACIYTSSASNEQWVALLLIHLGVDRDAET